jgi:ADP-heptose:LPS heptosyltransferase
MYFNKQYSLIIATLRIFSRLFDFRPKHQKIDLSIVQSVLILDYQQIGDIVVSTGFIRDLKLKFPHLEISIKGLPFLKDILEHDNHISQVYIDNGSWLNRWFTARKSTEKFDLVVCPRGDIRDIILGRLQSKKWLISFDFTGGNLFLDAVVPPGVMNHIAKRQIQLGRYLGIYHKDHEYTYELKVPISTKDKYPSNNIAIHIGSSRKLRQLPTIELFQIIDYLLDGGYFVTFFDAPGLKEGLIQDIEKRYNSKKLTIWNGKLADFILELPKYHSLITTDSAQSHMAAGWGMRTYVLFGPSRLEFCFPYGEKVSTIRKNNVKCSPCAQYKCTNSVHQFCYQGINRLFIEDFELNMKAT